jgi:hypothetical protein
MTHHGTRMQGYECAARAAAHAWRRKPIESSAISRYKQLYRSFGRTLVCTVGFSPRHLNDELFPNVDNRPGLPGYI